MEQKSGEDIEFQVYYKMTRTNNEIKNKKWTLSLIICCITVATGSFQFGYNISSMNSVTEILNDFIRNDTFLFFKYHDGLKTLKMKEGWLIGNETKLNASKEEYEVKKLQYIEAKFSMDLELMDRLEKQRQEKEKLAREKYNMTIDEYLDHATKNIASKKILLEEGRQKLADGKVKVEKGTKLVWTLTNTLFVIGGMIGTFTSKFIMDSLGRKVGILIHHIFGIAASVLVLIAANFHTPVCLMVSRLFFGVQGGMSCSFIPTYLSEISPDALRGRTGIIHQLCITIGIVVAQVIGLRQVLGNLSLWSYFLALPLIPAVLGCILLVIFLPESPRALISKNRDPKIVRKALSLLRNTDDVEKELEELNAENKGQEVSGSEGNITILGLFTNRDCRWPIITSIIIHVTQQLSGINAVFYYSSSIFKGAGIPDEYIQYAILSTGVINVITTIVCVPLIDKLGRKPLLIYPFIVMILDFACLIALLKLKGDSVILSYLSIVCIMVFIICFAVGLGPIPFIYTAECFRQNARSSAMALSTLTNWTAGLLLTLLFPFLLDLISQYVFLIFGGVIGFALFVIVTKVPETKGKSIEEIMAKFND